MKESSENTSVRQAKQRGYEAGKQNRAPSACPEYSDHNQKIRNAFREGFYKGFMEYKRQHND